MRRIIKEESFFESSRMTCLLLAIFLLCCLILLDKLFYDSIVVYALESLKGDCDMPNATNEQLVAGGYAGYYSADTNSIVVLSNFSSNDCMSIESYHTFLVHEMCHAEQHKENRMYNCNFRFGVLLNEMECYWNQGNFWHYFQNG